MLDISARFSSRPACRRSPMGSRDSRIALPAHSCVHVLPGAGASFPRFRSRSLVRSTRSGVWLRSRAEQTRDRSARLYAMSVNVLESMRLFAAADSGVLRGESFGGAAVTTRGVTAGPRTQRSSTPTCSGMTVSKPAYARTGTGRLGSEPVGRSACWTPAARKRSSMLHRPVDISQIGRLPLFRRPGQVRRELLASWLKLWPLSGQSCA